MSIIIKQSDGPLFEVTKKKGLRVRTQALVCTFSWFRAHGVKIRISPTATGWNLKFCVLEKIGAKTTDEHA